MNFQPHSTYTENMAQAIADNDTDGPIKRTTLIEELKKDPEGIKYVLEDDKELVYHVLFAISHQYEKLGADLILEILDYPAYYNITGSVTKGNVYVFNMQALSDLNVVLVNKVYYDTEQRILVVQVAKSSIYNQTLESSSRGGNRLVPRQNGGIGRQRTKPVRRSMIASLLGLGERST